MIPGSGGSVTVTGMSNAVALTFAVAGTGFTAGTPQISTNGTAWTTITSGIDIKGDPGAAAAYYWRMPVTVAANPSVSQRTATLRVTPAKGTVLSITLTQAASISSI
jgi:hypothetical protein